MLSSFTSRLSSPVRTVVFAFLLLIPQFSWAEEVNLTTLRKIFHNAVLDRSKIPAFAQAVDQLTEPSAIELAYKAAAKALKAQEEWNPLTKLDYLRQFEDLMDRAIMMNEQSIEIRFLRFGIQYNIPAVLGFSRDLNTDKMMIIEHLSMIDVFEVDQYYARYILTLLEDSRRYSHDEIELVKTKILPAPVLTSD